MSGDNSDPKLNLYRVVYTTRGDPYTRKFWAEDADHALRQAEYFADEGEAVSNVAHLPTGTRVSPADRVVHVPTGRVGTAHHARDGGEIYVVLDGIGADWLPEDELVPEDTDLG